MLVAVLQVVRDPMRPHMLCAVADQPDKMAVLDRLQSEPAVQTSWRLRTSQWIAGLVHLVSPAFRRSFDRSRFLALSRVMMINGYSWRFSDLPYSLALYDQASLLNNSCRPNTLGQHTQFGIRVKALRDIQAGEMLTAAYLPFHELARPTPYRRRRLQATKLFLCQCPRCLAPTDDTRVFNCGCGQGGAVQPTTTLATAEASHVFSWLGLAGTHAAASDYRCMSCGRESEPAVRPPATVLNAEARLERQFGKLWRQAGGSELAAVREELAGSGLHPDHWVRQLALWLELRTSSRAGVTPEWRAAMQPRLSRLAEWLTERTGHPTEDLGPRIIEVVNRSSAGVFVQVIFLCCAEHSRRDCVPLRIPNPERAVQGAPAQGRSFAAGGGGGRGAAATTGQCPPACGRLIL